MAISTRRKWLKRLGLILVGLLIAFLIVEIYFRYFFPPVAETGSAWQPERPYQHDRQVGLLYKSNWTGSLQTDEVDVTFKSNAQGFRAEENFITAEAGEVIAILGDSFTSGNQVPVEARFSNELSDLIAAEPLDWQPIEQVQNYGVDGTGCVHYLQQYRYSVRPHNPGIVIIVVSTINDFADSSPVMRYDKSQKPHFEFDAEGNITGVKPFTPPNEGFWADVQSWLRDNIATYRVIRVAQERLHDTGKGNLPRAYLFYEDPWQDELADAWRYCTWALETLITEARQDGAVPLVVLMPPQPVIVDETWQTIEDVYKENYTGSIQRDKISREMSQFTEQLDVAFLDLTPIMEESYEAGIRPYLEVDGHLNETGHDLVAIALYDKLQRLAPVERDDQ